MPEERAMTHTPKHTAEPWDAEYERDGCAALGWYVVGGEIGDEHVAVIDGAPNAERIVACVNALADRDPSKLAELEAAALGIFGGGPYKTPAQVEGLAESVERLAAALRAFRMEDGRA